MRPYETLVSEAVLGEIKQAEPQALVDLITELQTACRLTCPVRYETRSGWFVALQPLSRAAVCDASDERVVHLDGQRYYRTGRRREAFENEVKRVWEHLRWIYDDAHRTNESARRHRRAVD